MTSSSTVVFGPIDATKLPPPQAGRDCDEARVSELLLGRLKHMLERQGATVDERAQSFPLECHYFSGRQRFRIDLYGWDRENGYWTISYARTRGLWEKLFGIYSSTTRPGVTAAIHFALKTIDHPIETSWYVIPPGTLSAEYDLPTDRPQL